MKNILLLFIGLLGFQAMAQQGFKLGIHGGIPVNSEVNEVVGLNIGLDTGYLFALGEVVDAGVMAGYIHGFPEKFDVNGADLPAVQYLPLAGSFRIWPSNSFSFGADAGYALGLSEGNEGGLYYKPIIGYLFGTTTEINISYTGIQDDIMDWGTVNFGILYTFPEKPY